MILVKLTFGWTSSIRALGCAHGCASRPITTSPRSPVAMPSPRSPVAGSLERLFQLRPTPKPSVELSRDGDSNETYPEPSAGSTPANHAALLVTRSSRGSLRSPLDNLRCSLHSHLATARSFGACGSGVRRPGGRLCRPPITWRLRRHAGLALRVRQDRTTPHRSHTLPSRLRYSALSLRSSACVPHPSRVNLPTVPSGRSGTVGEHAPCRELTPLAE